MGTDAAPRLADKAAGSPPADGDAGDWHARLILPDARTHEFDSPFELSRFVSQAAAAPPRGLR